MIAIPIHFIVGYTEFSIDIDGVEYSFVFRWNERDSTWKVSMYYQEETIFSSLSLVPDVNLLLHTQNANAPVGALFAQGDISEDLSSGSTSFYYMSEEDLNALV